MGIVKLSNVWVMLACPGGGKVGREPILSLFTPLPDSPSEATIIDGCVLFTTPSSNCSLQPACNSSHSIGRFKSHLIGILVFGLSNYFKFGKCSSFTICCHVLKL